MDYECVWWWMTRGCLVGFALCRGPGENGEPHRSGFLGRGGERIPKLQKSERQCPAANGTVRSNHNFFFQSHSCFARMGNRLPVLLWTFCVHWIALIEFVISMLWLLLAFVLILNLKARIQARGRHEGIEFLACHST